jgi:hypothetical protein
MFLNIDRCMGHLHSLGFGLEFHQNEIVLSFTLILGIPSCIFLFHSTAYLSLLPAPYRQESIMNFTTGAAVSELLSLDHIRSQLIRLEDTIIFCEFYTR